MDYMTPEYRAWIDRIEDRIENHACKHCESRTHESDDCPFRPVSCDSCGRIWTRDEMFWKGDLLVGKCCEESPFADIAGFEG
jgi:hypothetical protein